jgi:hypothetical protein
MIDFNELSQLENGDIITPDKLGAMAKIIGKGKVLSVRVHFVDELGYPQAVYIKPDGGVYFDLHGQVSRVDSGLPMIDELEDIKETLKKPIP